MKDYMQNYFKTHPEVHERKKEYDRKVRRQRPKHIENAMSSLRRARKLKATPLWANKVKIESMYLLATEKAEQTGIPHCVDHIVPLRGHISKIHVVCGLHVEDNLQIALRVDNQKKSCVVWPDMPEFIYTSEDSAHPS